jgi:hypothetical protein
MELSGQLHAPAALLPGKEPLVPIGWWAPEPVWTTWKKEKTCISGNRSRAVQPVGIQTELSRLPNIPYIVHEMKTAPRDGQTDLHNVIAYNKCVETLDMETLLLVALQKKTCRPAKSNL